MDWRKQSNFDFSQIIVAELEKKVQKLQEDLTLSYKRNSDNATTMLELNQQVKVLEEDVKNKEVEYVPSLIIIYTN